MTLKHLRIFAEVCRMESITEAAKNLNMAQPAVSNAIRELEAFYQVKLFERMNRRLYITNAGEYLRGYADSILTQFEESRDILQDIAASTRIRIGSNVSFGANYLPKIISDFQSIHPEIPLFTMIQNSSHIEDCLLHNELDFAIVDNLSSHAGIRQTLIKEESMVALCSPNFSFLPAFSSTFLHSHHTHDKSDSFRQLSPELSIQDFEKIPLLVREPGSGCRDMLDKRFHQYESSQKSVWKVSVHKPCWNFVCTVRVSYSCLKRRRSIILLRGNYWRSMLQMQNSKDITILSIIRKNI